MSEGLEAGQDIGLEKDIAPRVFTKLGMASEIISASIHKAQQERDIRPEYEINGGVFVGKRMVEEIKKAGLGPETVTPVQILDIARKNAFGVAYYSGGIGHGIEGNVTEFERPEGVAGKKVGLPEEGADKKKLHEKIFASSGKKEPLENAVEFLEEEFEVVFTSEPPQRRGVLSSPAADAEARKVILRQIRGSGVTPEVYLWSNSGFKVFREFLAGYYALRQDINQAVKMGLLPKSSDKIEFEGRYQVKDENQSDLIMAMRTIGTDYANRPESYINRAMPKIKEALLIVKQENEKRSSKPEQYPPRFEELMPVHASGYDFLNYLELFKDLDINMGGAPEGAGSLTFPFDLGDKSLAGRLKSGLGIPVARTLVRYLGDNDQSPLFDAIIRSRPLPKKIRKWMYHHIPVSIKGNRENKLFPVYAAMMTGQYLPGNFDLMVTRLSQMGAANTPATRDIKRRSTGELMARAIMATSRGEGKTAVVVSPGVGNVVDDTKSKVPQVWEAMMPGNVLVVTGKPEVPHEGEYVRTVHGLIREKGILPQIRGIVAGCHLNLIEAKKTKIEQAGRIGPVTINTKGVAVSGSREREQLSYEVQEYRRLEQLVTSGKADQLTKVRFERFRRMFTNKTQLLYPTPMKELPNWLRTTWDVLAFLLDTDSPARHEGEEIANRWIPKQLTGDN